MDDDFDFGGYNPSINVNSRSGSMKKLTRKTDQSPKPVQTKPTIKNNDFDELDDLLNNDIKPKKKDTSLNKNQSTSLPKKGNDTLDSFFDEPSTNLNITSKINDKKQTTTINKNMDMARTSINWKVEKSEKKSDFDIIDQDNMMPSFSKVPKQRPRSPTSNQIKIPQQNSFGLDSHTSMRNMRPPMKRKDSTTGLGEKAATNNLSLGLSIVDDNRDTFGNASNNLGLSLIEDSSQPTRSINVGRRGSMDNKSEKRFETNLTLIGEQSTTTKNDINVSHFNIPERNNLTSVLKIDSPKYKKTEISEMKIGQSIMINEKNSHFYNPKNDNISILKHGSYKANESYSNLPNSSSYSFEKPHSKLVQPPKLSHNPPIPEEQSRSVNSYNYEKQVQQLKQTYQKQLNYLEETLDKQISIGQETRERLMKDANSMIEQERKRQSRIHEEEVKRIKDINDWEKKKMEDSYKFEIQNLKSAIAQYQTANRDRSQSSQPYNDSGNKNFKRQIDQLSEQLQLQKKLLLDRQNHLTKREFQLEQKIQQLNSKRAKQDEYFREQQRSLLEKENKLRNAILNEKKQFMDEKQKLAMDAANMELDIMKRKEKLDMLIKEQELEKNSIENERHEMRVLNQQMMTRYKEKMNELGQDKERVANIEADMIRKLRIIQLKAKQGNIPLHNTHSNQTKQNNWVRPQSTAGEKQERLNETFQRYSKVEKLANQKSVITHTMNRTSENSGQVFKLEDYLTAINKNGKSRQNNFI